MTSNLHAEQNSFIELLNILKNKEVISQETFQQLKDSALPLSSPSLNNDDVLIMTKGKVEVQSSDSVFSAEIGGRLMVDYASYQQDQVTLGSGTELRRARLEMEGTLYEQWGYELSVDFGDTSQEVDLKDAYISYSSNSDYSILVGQFKEPFSLEELTSSKNITFMERALPNEFTPGRNIGIGFSTSEDNWSFATGVFGQAVDDGDNSENDEGWGLSARGAYAPWVSKHNVLHLGLSITRREPNGSGEISFSSRPESHVTDVKYLNTGDIQNVEYYSGLGAEVAWVADSLSLQSEYINTSISTSTSTNNYNFSGWYIFASYFITGEARRYKAKSSKFSGVKPINKSGAWEVALRHSMVDMNDIDVFGGEGKNITLGLNWYANKNARVMLNYIIVNNDLNANDDGDVTGNDDPRLFQARLQLHF